MHVHSRIEFVAPHIVAGRWSRASCARHPLALAVMALSLGVLATGCPGDPVNDGGDNDAGVVTDAGGERDGGSQDAGNTDAGPDAGDIDGGTDGGPVVVPDGGPDGGQDGGLDGGQDGGPDGGQDGGPQASTVHIEVVGWGALPVFAGEVKIGDRTESIVNGEVDFADLPDGEFRGIVKAPGFAPANVFGRAVTGQTTIAQARLLKVGTVIDFDAATGVDLRYGNLGVALQPNSFVDANGVAVTGTITAHITPFDLDTDMPAAPGPFRGQDELGTVDLIESFGMGEFTFEQGGQPVQLAPEMTALVSVELAETANVQPGDVIPAWHYDLEQGHWVQEGVGSVVSNGSRLIWRADVSHFSWWNCDVSINQKECVKVRVNNLPGISGMALYSDGLDYAGLDVTSLDVFGEGCVEFKLNSTARVHAGGGPFAFSTSFVVTGTGNPSSCSLDNGSGCGLVIIDVPELACVTGQITQAGVGQPNAEALYSYSSDVGVVRGDGQGRFCAEVPVGDQVNVFAHAFDNTGAFIFANASGTAPSEETNCGMPQACTDLGQIELTTPPQYCIEGVATQETFSGVIANLDVGTPLFAYRGGTFTGVNCSRSPENWGTMVGRTTVGQGGGYCLTLPLGENNRDIVFAADECTSFGCSSEFTNASCFNGDAFTLSPGDELIAAGSQCGGSVATCAQHTIEIAQ